MPCNAKSFHVITSSSNTNMFTVVTLIIFYRHWIHQKRFRWLFTTTRITIKQSKVYAIFVICVISTYYVFCGAYRRILCDILVAWNYDLISKGDILWITSNSCYFLGMNICTWFYSPDESTIVLYLRAIPPCYRSVWSMFLRCSQQDTMQNIPRSMSRSV